MQDKLYSIIVVTLNAGEELIKTVDSILKQTEQRYEIIIKDGFSADGSIEKLPQSDKIHIYPEKDKGIYDAMNQAIVHATGKYLIFMNCGDYFYNETVLAEVTKNWERMAIQQTEKQHNLANIDNTGFITPDIIYGNLYNRKLDTVIYASPTINAFACYRNVPCHQTCFYKRDLFAQRAYNPKYTVRADYEHFLWCYFEKHATTQYLDLIIANYQGGGYSETPENLRKSNAQHQEIVEKYMGKKQALKYKTLLLLSLAPLRKKMAESEKFSVVYNKVKTSIYKLKN